MRGRGGASGLAGECQGNQDGAFTSHFQVLAAKNRFNLSLRSTEAGKIESFCVALSRATASHEGLSMDRRRRSARDTRSSDEGLPRCQVEGPSTSDMERPDRT